MVVSERELVPPTIATGCPCKVSRCHPERIRGPQHTPVLRALGWSSEGSAFVLLPGAAGEWIPRFRPPSFLFRRSSKSVSPPRRIHSLFANGPPIPVFLILAHENCSLPIRSHGRRFLRQFRAHPRNGRRSPAPRRRFGRIFRTLCLRLSAPGPPRTPRLPRTQSGRDRLSRRENALAHTGRLRRARRCRHRQTRLERRRAPGRWPYRLRAAQNAAAHLRCLRRIALFPARAQPASFLARRRKARHHYLRGHLERQEFLRQAPLRS